MLARMRPALVFVAALVFAPTAGASPTSVVMTGPAYAEFGRTIVLRGSVSPPEGSVPISLVRDGQTVGLTLTRVDGSYAFSVRVAGPARYEARTGELVSAPVAPLVRPRLTARVIGSRAVGRPLRLVARLHPAQAGELLVRVVRNGRVTLSTHFVGHAKVGLRTRQPGRFRIGVIAKPAQGWAPRSRIVRAVVVFPRAALGSRGPSVLELERRLRELRYALPRIDRHYDFDTYQAVLAFQKVRGLPPTGRVDARVWRALSKAHIPWARHRGNHVEVSKSRQVLYLVRAGKVELVVHISTGATGNTPVGRWRVYRKSVGWDWVLWYPMYFLRGFAIHGYPSVPPYPASHGCVRVPMWVAPRLFSSIRYGESIYVY